MVIGLYGSCLWLAMLCYIGWVLRSDQKLFVFYTAMLVSYLAMGAGLEVFQLSKSGAIFWVVAGMLVGVKRQFKTLKVSFISKKQVDTTPDNVGLSTCERGF